MLTLGERIPNSAGKFRIAGYVGDAVYNRGDDLFIFCHEPCNYRLVNILVLFWLHNTISLKYFKSIVEIVKCLSG